MNYDLVLSNFKKVCQCDENKTVRILTLTKEILNQTRWLIRNTPESVASLLHLVFSRPIRFLLPVKQLSPTAPSSVLCVAVKANLG